MYGKNSRSKTKHKSKKYSRLSRNSRGDSGESSSSDAFPLPALFFNIHRLRGNLDNIDILILGLNLAESSRVPCSSSSKILTSACHI